ncbi:glycosyltransferase family 4 protein [Halorussus caseinilyticus]|uniref:Glycosyltransferase family 4 protein n=1 Tax=Halorussus caseinilyticus TaxID=3034025 RepID=A0ABD5WFM6_9EURY|nr:glycosyltransferase family 4 protein [Halorussus sp. DT72]
MSGGRPTVLGFTDMRSEELVTPLEATNAPGRILSFEGTGPVAKFVRAVVRGVGVFRESEVDAILLYNGTGVLGLVSVLLAGLYRVPLVVRVNGDIYRQHADRLDELRSDDEYARTAVFLLYHLLTRLTYRVATGYVTVSEDLRERIEFGTTYPNRATATVYNPVDAAEFRNADRPDESDVDLAGNRVLVTVTNLDFEGKCRGTVEIIDAVADVLAENDDVTYVVAGDGTYLDALETYVETRVPDETAERIHLLGYVDDVPSLLAAADVFVYKSYIDGYPNVILEAQAAGLPVIANPAYGIGEQISHGRTGLLVPDDGDASYRRAVEKLLADESLRERLGRNAARTVRDENAHERVGDELLAAVSRIVARR